MRRVNSFVYCSLVLTFVVVEWSFVVLLYLSSGWFCRGEICEICEIWSFGDCGDSLLLFGCTLKDNLYRLGPSHSWVSTCCIQKYYIINLKLTEIIVWRVILLISDLAWKPGTLVWQVTP